MQMRLIAQLKRAERVCLQGPLCIHTASRYNKGTVKLVQPPLFLPFSSSCAHAAHQLKLKPSRSPQLSTLCDSREACHAVIMRVYICALCACHSTHICVCLLALAQSGMRVRKQPQRK